MIQVLFILALTAVTVFCYAKYRLRHPVLMFLYATLMCGVIIITSIAIHAPKELIIYVLIAGIIGVTVIELDTLSRLPRRRN